MRRLFGVSGIYGRGRARHTLRTFIGQSGRTFQHRRDISAPLKQSAFPSAFVYSLRWQSTSNDYYSVLGVPPDASADEIKAAYKKLALQYHPDRNSDPGAEDMFKNISEAYNVVGSKQRRKEYDMRRGGPFGASGGSSAGRGASRGASYGQTCSHGTTGYQHISKEEADRLFREIFGGMRVDQIFRGLDEEMQRSHAMGKNRSRVSMEFNGQEQAFRPFFRNDSTRVFTDQHGNKMEERTFTDPRGTTFTVRTTTSEQPNASVNYKQSEYYSEKGDTSNDGRFHYGNSSFKVNPRGFTDDFGKAYLGVRTHGRHPLIGMLIIAAWATIIGTIVLGTFTFLVTHPLFFLAVVSLFLLRRVRFP